MTRYLYYKMQQGVRALRPRTLLQQDRLAQAGCSGDWHGCFPVGYGVCLYLWDDLIYAQSAEGMVVMPVVPSKACVARAAVALAAVLK